MNSQQLNRLAMYRSLQDYLQRHAAIVGKIPACEEIVSLFNKNVASIERAAEVQAGVTAGKTDVKVLAEEQLIDFMIRIGASVRIYARRAGLLEMDARVSTEKWALRGLRDTELLTRARLFLDEVTQHAGELGKYGVDEAALESFRLAVVNFGKAMGTRESSLADRKTARNDLQSLILNTDRLLSEELDGMIEHYRNTDEAFYNNYHQLRVTKSLGVRRKSNGESAAPVNGNGNGAGAAATGNATPTPNGSDVVAGAVHTGNGATATPAGASPGNGAALGTGSATTGNGNATPNPVPAAVIVP
ncbi:MAG: hypothetical protein HY962_09125 [Ignavibacteriae bacterium]|nr:hypothetical protein [Ignavibacteriota bacterium]